MNQATKTQIENEAKLSSVKKYPVDLCEEKGYPIKIGEDFNEYDRDLFKRGFIAGATKYAELLEQEKAKGEKLVAALEELKEDIRIKVEAMWGYIDDVKKLKQENENLKLKALTEYKK